MVTAIIAIASLVAIGLVLSVCVNTVAEAAYQVVQFLRRK